MVRFRYLGYFCHTLYKVYIGKVHGLTMLTFIPVYLDLFKLKVFIKFGFQNRLRNSSNNLIHDITIFKNQ